MYQNAGFERRHSFNEHPHHAFAYTKGSISSRSINDMAVLDTDDSDTASVTTSSSLERARNGPGGIIQAAATAGQPWINGGYYRGYHHHHNYGRGGGFQQVRRLQDVQGVSRQQGVPQPPPPPQQQQQQQQQQQYDLDPIWCEDPLNPHNNVLRNTFRVVQVLRAFSDAHRSILASLEFTSKEEIDIEIQGVGLEVLASLLKNMDSFS